jgi:hypothetical protein
MAEEVSVAAIDPDREAARPGDRNQIELPVAVEVDRRELDDGRVRVQPALAVPGREADNDFRGPNPGLDPVVDAVAVQVGKERLGRDRCRRGSHGHRERKESEGATRDAAHVVNYTVAIPSCHEFIAMNLDPGAATDENEYD